MMNNGYINKLELIQNIPMQWGFEIREKIKYLIENTKEIDLLERDKGKEPILENIESIHHESYADGTGGFRKSQFLDWLCPTCGWFVGELYSGNGIWHIQEDKSYCARCGQKIDWSLPEEEEKRRYEKRKEIEREKAKKMHGMELDNMYESRRKKYGMLSERRVGDED